MYCTFALQNARGSLADPSSSWANSGSTTTTSPSPPRACKRSCRLFLMSSVQSPRPSRYSTDQPCTTAFALHIKNGGMCIIDLTMTLVTEADQARCDELRGSRNNPVGMLAANSRHVCPCRPSRIQLHHRLPGRYQQARGAP
jgi:hypothetical protein